MADYVFDLSILLSTPPRHLAEWWCELNCWRWPPDLPNKPAEWDSLPARDIRTNRDKYTLLNGFIQIMEQYAGGMDAVMVVWREKYVPRYW